MTGQLDPAEFSMTSDQIGELLATALSESSDQEETALPARVAKFLRSSRCEELQGDGQAIESGEAVIENGKLLRREETDDEAQPEPL